MRLRANMRSNEFGFGSGADFTKDDSRAAGTPVLHLEVEGSVKEIVAMDRIAIQSEVTGQGELFEVNSLWHTRYEYPNNTVFFVPVNPELQGKIFIAVKALQ